MTDDTIEVSRADLIKVADAITDGAVDSGRCRYCQCLYALSFGPHHSKNCPVLIAQDIRPRGES